VVKRKAELSDYLAELEPKYQKTVQWWIEADNKLGHRAMVEEIAELYRRQYLESQPGPKGKKAPSEVDRELGRIATTINRLLKQLGDGASPEAKRRLRGQLQNTHLGGWLDPVSVSEWVTMGPFGGRQFELKDLAEKVLEMRGGAPKKPLHFSVIRWITARLRAAGRPRSHVLPIVQCIHRWASEGEPVSEDFGKDYLDSHWPPAPPKKGAK
jgi:hypothetical protein